jgi:hypothetical protein
MLRFDIIIAASLSRVYQSAINALSYSILFLYPVSTFGVSALFVSSMWKADAERRMIARA